MLGWWMAGCALLPGRLPVPDFVGPTLTPTPSPTPLATPTPTPTPEPETALPPDFIWVGVDGKGDAMIALSPDGEERRVVSLPLNEGQAASSPVASRNGEMLAYLVWDEVGEQHGIATWDPTEPNARLVARPQPGYRIIALYLSDDGRWLAYVQIEEGVLPDQAQWRVDGVRTGGNDATLVATRETLGDVPPPIPFAWQSGSPLLVNAAAPSGLSRGVYALNVEAGMSHPVLVPEEDTLIVAPTLAPDGRRIAYLSHHDPPVALSDPTLTNELTILTLEDGESLAIAAGAGRVIYGVRWHPDGERVLLDLVDLPTGGEGSGTQHWALIRPEGGESWDGPPSGIDENRLFDYEPLGEGVVYTLLPDGGPWELTILSRLNEQGTASVISLEEIAQEPGAPTIVYVPRGDQ